MVVRTISQLPKAGFNDIINSDNTYVEISLPHENNRYLSRKTTITDINKIATSKLSNQMVDDYELKREDESNISIREHDKEISSLYYGDIDISGIKNFKTYPMISTDFPTDEEIKQYGKLENIIPNIKKVKEITTNTPAFISTTSSMVAEGSPFRTFMGNAVDYNGSSICYREFQSSDKFYYWRIADGKKDSSETIYDQIDGSQKHFVEIRDTGYLVVWGWVSDSGTVAADMSWVGLFGRMKYQGDDTAIANIPLQIQPWIQGSKSSDMQYVGFGIPVRKGLQLNIRTGFPVSGGSNGAFQRPGSMTFQDGWIANSFVGYVIKSQE